MDSVTESGVKRRVAVVSGGGTGIGRAVAVRLAQAGLRVAVVGRRPAPLAATCTAVQQAHERHGGPGSTDPALALTADLTRPAEVEKAARELLSWSGGVVDVVVNNAGGIDRSPAVGLDGVAAAWESDWRTNVLTAVLLTEALVPAMTEDGGRVINISSIAALRGGGGSYSAAKAALHGWTFGLATELAPRGVTVNVVAPGFVDGTEFFGGSMTDSRRERLVSQIPLGRPGTAEEVANLVAWLASTESTLVTGQVVQANGGALVGR